jgi:hypothetical protein
MNKIPTIQPRTHQSSLGSSFTVRGGKMVKPLSSQLYRAREAARRGVWRRQCEVVQSFGRNRFEVGFTTEEGNEALIAAGLPTLNSAQMDRALKSRTNTDA